MVAVDLVGKCQAPCGEEARKVGEIAVYFRAHAIDSIARRQYRAVIKILPGAWNRPPLGESPHLGTCSTDFNQIRYVTFF